MMHVDKNVLLHVKCKLADPKCLQSFHNVIRPDSFDAANKNFMFGALQCTLLTCLLAHLVLKNLPAMPLNTLHCQSACQHLFWRTRQPSQA
jgi:hypothetical protein